jgi:predicted metal-dependent HD superfamily phosphohydrolase
MSPERLAARWGARMAALGVPPGASAPQLALLLAAYGEPHRAHHRLEHVAHLFAELDGVPLADAAVELATWYHDAVYRPGRPDNERRSAALAAGALEELGLQRLAARVVQLIEATRLHRAEPDDDAALLFLDADLAILGAAPAVYERYADGVRAEHRAVPGFLFARGRRAFLAELLASPSIFRTSHFRDRYEQQAGENVRRELERLAGMGYSGDP